MRTVGLTLGMLLLVAVAHAAADEPLRVYGYGASRASVYVAPMKGRRSLPRSTCGARSRWRCP
jgi:hypothetical protein